QPASSLGRGEPGPQRVHSHHRGGQGGDRQHPVQESHDRAAADLGMKTWDPVAPGPTRFEPAYFAATAGTCLIAVRSIAVIPPFSISVPDASTISPAHSF